MKRKRESASAPSTSSSGQNDSALIGRASRPMLAAAYTGTRAEATADEVRARFNNAKPWKHAVLPDFLREDACTDVLEELLQETWFKKNNDLYRFVQTEDLRRSSQRTLAALRATLFGDDFRRFLARATGSPALLPVVDMAGQIYRRGDHLLCHDDSLEGRRLAFILYLVPASPPWSATRDGGALQLLPVGAERAPLDPDSAEARRNGALIVPRWNTLAFFEVNSVSYHHVREVLGSRARISITGWFHAISLPPPLPLLEAPVPRVRLHVGATPARARSRSPREVSEYGLSDAEELAAWLAPAYLAPATLAQLRARLEEDGAVSLGAVLREDVYAAVLRALEVQRSAAWVRCGPVNRRRYCRLLASAERATPAAALLEALRSLLTSAAWARWLTALCGVAITSLDSPVWRRWRAGDYTLTQDAEERDLASTAGDRVNVDLVFGVQAQDAAAWTPDAGGYLVYLARNADAELFTQPCSSNTLTLVLRGPDTLRFVKYLTHAAPGTRYDLATTYYTHDED